MRGTVDIANCPINLATSCYTSCNIAPNILPPGLVTTPESIFHTNTTTFHFCHVEYSRLLAAFADYKFPGLW